MTFEATSPSTNRLKEQK